MFENVRELTLKLLIPEEPIITNSRLSLHNRTVLLYNKNCIHWLMTDSFLFAALTWTFPW